LLSLVAGIAVSAALISLALDTDAGASLSVKSEDAYLVMLRAHVPHAIPHGASWNTLYSMR
jgi:hypothetical protein